MTPIAKSPVESIMACKSTTYSADTPQSRTETVIRYSILSFVTAVFSTRTTRIFMRIKASEALEAKAIFLYATERWVLFPLRLR